MPANVPDSLDYATTECIKLWPSTYEDLKRRGIVIETPFEKSRIGDGATAEVYKGKEAGERVVAVKVYVDPDGSHQHERTGRTVPMENYFLNERSMLIGLRESSHVPTYYQSVDNQTKYVDQRIQPYHVMEYVDAMGIGDYARKHLVPDRDHDTALGLFEQLLHAVNDLHTHGEGYLHRDLSGNNAVVDRRGNVRLLDLATGSERSAEHTRVVTVGGETPGYGTDAPVSEEKKTHRKCIADDVHSTCVIGYELFTGHAKEEGQSDVDRRSLLSKEGVHVGIANILMRGMQPVNREIEYDQRRFNDCREVLQAIYEHRESIRRLAASRRVRAQWLWFVCASTVVLALFGLLGYAFYLRYRDARYSALTQQFLEGRAELAEYSDEDQTDPRVQNAVRSAESAYDESQSQFNSGEIDLAVAAILRGNASMSRAGKIADRLQQIRPIVMPVGELLSGDYTQWNTRCDIVRDQYDAFSKQYTLVMNLLDPDASESNAGSAAIDTTQKLAREVPKLQAMQVRLVRDDKLSREIGDRYDHFDTSISVLAPSLRQHHEFKQITGRRQTSYERYYQQGRWEDARVAIRSHELAVNAFIKRHETTEQKQQRLSAGAETIAKQIAENESLQKEAKRLAQQIETLTNDKRDLMAQVGGERVRYENVSQQLQTTTARLQTATTDLAGVRQSLQTTRDERDTLVAYKSDIDEKHAALKQRLQSIEAANEQLSGSLAMTRRELASARDTLKGLQESSGASAAEVRLAQSLRRAITDARKYQPKDWDDANEKLVAASRRYRDLQIKDLAETKLGKTRRHADRKALAQQMDATFKIAITALKKRDEVDVASDGALQSQIRVQQAERKLKTEGEGWAETARIVVAIDRKIQFLESQRKKHAPGVARQERDQYAFADFEALAKLPSVKHAAAMAVFSDLQHLQEFRDTFDQTYVYLKPDTFQMGSPANETGRGSDERQHSVTLSRGFFIGKMEVNQLLWRSVTGKEPWKGKSRIKNGDAYPAVYVSWEDIRDDFLPKFNQMMWDEGLLPDGWEFVLPTEAQWEYAARAGTTTRFHFGDSDSRIGDYAWFEDNAGQDYAHRVGTKKPNPWGLHDFSGNVWEWCRDVYVSDYPSTEVDPFVTSGGSFRVNRGGGFSSSSSNCRSADRSRSSPGYRQQPGLPAGPHSSWIRPVDTQAVTVEMAEPDRRQPECLREAEKLSPKHACTFFLY